MRGNTHYSMFPYFGFGKAKSFFVPSPHSGDCFAKTEKYVIQPKRRQRQHTSKRTTLTPGWRGGDVAWDNATIPTFLWLCFAPVFSFGAIHQNSIACLITWLYRLHMANIQQYNHTRTHSGNKLLTQMITACGNRNRTKGERATKKRKLKTENHTKWGNQ